jgi:hypothetical protein
MGLTLPGIALDVAGPGLTSSARTAAKGGWMITKLDFVAIPSRDANRSRAFYGETLGLRPDDHGGYEFWAGESCPWNL